MPKSDRSDSNFTRKMVAPKSEKRGAEVTVKKQNLPPRPSTPPPPPPSSSTKKGS